MATLEELLAKKNETQLIDAEENSDVSTIGSIFAGIGTGLIEIPKGLFSLGASIYDLTNDTNKAAEVEKWFEENIYDNLGDIDDIAEATAAGKITKTLVNIGVPGGLAFRAGTRLANTAINSRKAGNYFKVTGADGKALKNASKTADLLNKKGKTAKFVAGATAGGVAEGVFVGDVEEVGTFGDLLGGPTELERGEGETDYDPNRELINRIKFGTEGALFNLGIIGAGKGIKALRGSGDKVLDEYCSNSIKRNFETFGEFGFSPAGTGPRSTFETKEYFEGMKKAANRAAAEEVKNLDILALLPFIIGSIPLAFLGGSFEIKK